MYRRTNKTIKSNSKSYSKRNDNSAQCEEDSAPIQSFSKYSVNGDNDISIDPALYRYQTCFLFLK